VSSATFVVKKQIYHEGRGGHEEEENEGGEKSEAALVSQR